MAKKIAFYGWTLVAVLFLTDLLLMGLPYYSVINTYMLKQIHMSRSLYGLGFTLANLFYGLPSTLVAVVILRWGLRTTFAIGAALLLCGNLWLAFFVTQPWEYLLSFGVLIGTGFAFTTNVPITTAITRWFKRYRGRAMALALSGAGVGGFVGSPMVDRILTANRGNWQQAWKVMAVLAFLAGLVAVFFVKERPEDLGQVADGSLERSPAGSDLRITNSHWTPSQAYRSRSFWLVVIGAIACKFPVVLHAEPLGSAFAGRRNERRRFRSRSGNLHHHPDSRSAYRWVAGGQDPRPVCFDARLLLLFMRRLSGDSSGLAYDHAGERSRPVVWDRLWVDLHRRVHVDRALLWSRALSEIDRNAGADLIHTGRAFGSHRRQPVR